MSRGKKRPGAGELDPEVMAGLLRVEEGNPEDRGPVVEPAPLGPPWVDPERSSSRPDWAPKLGKDGRPIAPEAREDPQSEEAPEEISRAPYVLGVLALIDVRDRAKEAVEALDALFSPKGSGRRPDDVEFTVARVSALLKGAVDALALFEKEETDD